MKVLKYVLPIVFCATTVFAQENYAVVTGDVLDATGAKVPDAVVTALNTATGVATTQKSNAAGAYTFLTLQPGEYNLTAEKTGFKKFVMNKISLRVADHVEINVKLEIGVTSDTVQVTGDAEAVNYLTTTQGGLVNSQRISDLPTIGRSVMDFVTTMPGLIGNPGGNAGVSVNGTRFEALNVTLDGVNILDNVVNETIQNVQIGATTDRIGEVAVITSPNDAEFGRGMGQVIATSRAGTNKFHGALYDQLENNNLNADSWGNNRAVPFVPRTFLAYNNPGGRIDGPIKKNKIFFFGLFEGITSRTHSTQTATVYTPTALKGIFRFYPGVTNSPALSKNPVVDSAGNPVTPAGATGALQSVSLYGLDPNRLVPDPSGNATKALSLLPQPNNYAAGDGLNTAGYNWIRVVSNTLYSFTTRLDYNINQTHRINISYSRDQDSNPNNNDGQSLPTAKGGLFDDYAFVLSGGLTSTLRANLVNQLTGGVTTATFDFLAPWSVSGTGILPSINGQPYILGLSTVTNPYSTGTGEDPQGRKAPVYQVGDKISWIHGIHTIKAGVDARILTDNLYVSFDVMPRVSIGTGNASSQNITTISGIGANGSSAVNLLNNLSGSIGSVTQQFYTNGGANPQFTPGLRNNHAWQQNEMDSYVQDNIKLARNLTINAGVRWEYYGVPNEQLGRMVGLQGGSQSIFGVSGTNFANALFQPGSLNGSLSQFALIGANSPNPSIQPWNKNLHNFAPIVGLAWTPPWEKFGMNKMTLRMGYSISYERDALVLLDQLYGFGAPGFGTTVTSTFPSYANLSAVSLPLVPTTVPLQTVPINDTNSTTQTELIVNNGTKTPYIQNWNVALGRELGHGIVLDVRYVGTKGTKLMRGTNIDEINVIENGILNAFQVTDAGGNAPLLDKIFKGLNVPGVGVVDGVNITGSQAVRGNSTLNAYLLSNNVGGFANFLAYNTFITGIRGGLLKNGGLPVNFVDANPQFGAADLIGNLGNSTYHSGQFELNKRFGSGVQIQASYVRSKTLGDFDGNSQSDNSSFLTIRNQHLDKRIISLDVPNVIRTSGIWELPIGPHQKLLGGTHGALARIVERWQTAIIFNKLSGSATDFSDSAGGTFNNLGAATPVLNGPIPTGSVHFSGNNVLYFNGLTQVADPSIQNIPAALRSQSSLFAIQGANGNTLLQNPLLGTLGGTNPSIYRGLGTFTFNLQVSKAILINAERNITLRLRADATNLLNHPIWGTPNLNVDSVNFGLITSASGTRNIALTARIEF